MAEKIALNLSETAKLLGCSRNYLYNNILHTEGFPCVKIGGRIFVPVKELEHWLADRAAKGE